MPSLPRRNLLIALGTALAGIGGGPFDALRAFAAVGAAPMPVDDVTRPPLAWPDLFGTHETLMDGLLTLMPKAAVLQRCLAARAAGPVAAGLVPVAAGAAGREEPCLKRWDRVLAELRGGTDPMAQIAAVNDFVNTVDYISDRRNYGTEDYWATPAEFFAVGGDCEDYALTKFVSLRRLGFHEDRLRIAIVFDERRRLHHAVLAVFLGDDIYVLDNQIKAVTPHRRISHYRPICSFDSHRLWVCVG